MTIKESEIKSVKDMDEHQRIMARERVSISDPDHLKRWLEESNRKWLVLDSSELVDALPWPEGVAALMQILMARAHHRAAMSTGRTKLEKSPITGQTEAVPVSRTEELEIEELDRAARYIISLASELDPSWSLENPPL